MPKDPRSPVGPEPHRRPSPPSDLAALAPDDVAGLLGVARAVARAVEHGDIARLLAQEVLELARAARVAIWEEDRQHASLSCIAEISSSPGQRVEASGAMLGSPVWDALRSRQPVWIHSADDARERYPGCPLDPCGARAFVPSLSDGQAGRVLELAFMGTREFSARDRALLGAVAAMCADALARGSLFTQERMRAERAETARATGDGRSRRADQLVSDRTHLYERERFARGRAENATAAALEAAGELERAQAILGALAAAADQVDVLAVLSARAAQAFGAITFAVTRRVSALSLETLRAVGFPEEVAAAGSRLDVDGTPEGEVVRSGAPVWLETRDEVARRFPGAARGLLRLGGVAWLGVPISYGGETVGTLALGFGATRTFAPDERARVVRLALQCAAALARRSTRTTTRCP